MIHKKHHETIRELKKRILHAEQGKQKVIEHAELLRAEYESHKINKKEYLKAYHKGIHGKSIEEWITYYDDYIKHCKTRIKNREVSIGRTTMTFIGIGLLLFTVLMFTMLQEDPSFIGYSVSEGGESESGGDSGEGDSGGGSEGGSDSGDSGGGSSESGGSDSGEGDSDSGSDDAGSDDSDSESGSEDTGNDDASSGETNNEENTENEDEEETVTTNNEEENTNNDGEGENEDNKNNNEEENDENDGESANNENEETTETENDNEEETNETEENTENENNNEETTETANNETNTTENDNTSSTNETVTHTNETNITETTNTTEESTNNEENEETTETENDNEEETTSTTNETNETSNNETNVTILVNLTEILNNTELTNKTNTTITDTNETNNTIIEEANITTVQYKAVLGKPVRWKKRVDLETAGATTITIPKEAENVSVTKINETNETEEQEVTAETISESQNIINSSLEEETIVVLDKTAPEEQKENSEEEANFTITGKIINGGGATTAEESRITHWFKIFIQRLISSFTGRTIQELNIDNAETNNTTITEVQELNITDNAETYEVEYETPAPYAIETETRKGKTVEIIGPENVHYEQVLSFTQFSEEFNITDTSKVRIYWKEQNTHLTPTTIEDLDGNGIYDYVEWITPRLSNQTIEIILISAAEHLDENKTFIADIYNETSAVDDVWVTINDSEWVRVTFEKNLTSINDITLYARSNNSNATVEVYHYNTSNNSLAKFPTINNESYYKILLTNMTGSHDTFDLKIIGGIDIDLIIDPTIKEIGHLTWPRNYSSNHPGAHDDHAEDTVIDSNDYVYHVGWGYNLTSQEQGWNIDSKDDWWIKKFFLNGTEITEGWDKRINNINYNDSDRALGAAVDSNNNVYVVGYTNNTTSYSGGFGELDWWIKQFNSTGTENTSWAYQFDGAIVQSGRTGEDDTAWSVTVDSNNNVYVVGSGEDLAVVNGGQKDGWIKKFFPNATESTNGWNKIIEGSGFGNDDELFDVDVDSENNITVVGYSHDGANPGAAWGDDHLLIKFNPAGTEYGGGASGCGGGVGECYDYFNQPDRIHGVKHLANDSFQIIGYLTHPSGRGKDWYVKEFWYNNTPVNGKAAYVSAYTGDDEGNEILIDENNDTYTVGYVTHSGIQQYTVTYHWFENLSKIEQVNYTQYNNSEAEGIWQASNKDIFVSGWGTNITNQTTPGSAEDWWLRLYEGTADITDANVKFVNPTPAGSTIINYTDVGINFTISERYLESIIYDWNGTNYSFYNNSLIILFNFDNRTDLLDGTGGGATVYDASRKGNNGTLLGANNPGNYNNTGKYGKAKIFNKTTSALGIFVNNNTQINNDSSFSASFWYNIDGTGTFNASQLQGFFHKKNSSGIGYEFETNATAGWIQFTDSCGLTKRTNDNTLNLTGWHQLTITVNNGCEASGVKIYHDGIETSYQTSTGSGTLNDNAYTSLFIGQGLNASSGMNGSMDNFMLWNRTLSVNEVDQLYMTNIVQYGREQYYYYTLQQENATNINLKNGNYTFRGYATDQTGNVGATEEREIQIDADQTGPNTTFIAPTPANDSNLAENYFTYNISINETNLEEFTIQRGNLNTTIYQKSTALAYFNFNNISTLGENQTVVYDITGKGHNATCNNLATCPSISNANNILEQARTFNSTTFMTLNNSTTLHQLDINTSFTIEGWIKTNHTGTEQMAIMSLQDERGRGILLGITGANTLTGKVNTTNDTTGCGAQVSETATGIKNNEWHHLALTYSGTTHLVTIWFDGSNLPTGSLTCNTGNMNLHNHEWYIGKENDSGTGLGSESYFNGSIAGLSLHNREFSATEINSLANDGGILKRTHQDLWIFQGNDTELTDGTHNITGYAQDNLENWNATETRYIETGADATPPQINFTAPTPANDATITHNWTDTNVSINDINFKGAVFDWNGTNYTLLDRNVKAFYNFDNLSALGEHHTSNVMDISGNNNNITNFTGFGWIGPTSGKYGGAANFNAGASSYLAINDSNDLDGTANFSISLWVRPNLQDDATPNGVISKTYSYAILIDEDTRCVSFYLKNSTTEDVIQDQGNCPGLNEWRHIIASYNGTHTAIFENGTRKNLTTISTNFGNINSSIADVILGSNTYSGTTEAYFNGSMDDLMIWQRAIMTEEEARMIHATSLQRRTNETWHLLNNQTERNAGTYNYTVWGFDENSNYNSTGQRTLTISDGAGTPPSIFFIESISAQNPVESGTRNIIFNINISDSAGVADLDHATLNATFSRNTEPTRYNDSCKWTTNYTGQNTATFSCTISMQYYDEAGSWNINVSIKDDGTDIGINSSESFTYNLLHSMTVNTTNITFPVIAPTSTDTGSNNDPVTITNTGNDENLTVNVTAYNLLGWDTPTDIIYAGNFTVGTTSQGCSGTALANDTRTEITGAEVDRGTGTAGQENLYFCIKEVPNTISQQVYNSTTYGAWTIQTDTS